jgi:malonate transporter and related proteins
MDSIAVKTTIPIFFLIGVGFLSRKTGILKSGDERVLSAYVYYFAMPALSLLNLAETEFTAETFRFMLAGILPVFGVLVLYLLLYYAFRLPKHTVYLWILSSVFGSVSFFGVPFISFAFPTKQGEHLALLAVTAIAPTSVAFCIMVLELYKLRTASLIEGFKPVLINFCKNPLILSILLGFFLGLTRVKIPSLLLSPIRMIGNTTSATAIFMLGVFLYGRKYTSLLQASQLSLIRIILLPCLAFFATRLLGLPHLESTILILMHGTPIAVSVIVLSERYDFFTETIASLTLVSSLAGGIFLTLLLLLLGYR